MMHVAAAIIKNEIREILICRRGAGGDCAYLWEFPGGKREKGESPEQCLIRECHEELGVGIAIEKVFAETVYKYPEWEINFTFFLAKIISGSLRLGVHKEMEWVKSSDLSNYEFCPADVEIVAKLVGENNII